MAIFIGYCITKKSVDDVKAEINNVLELNHRRTASIQEEKALNRLYCEKTIRFLDVCFEEMYGIEKCKRMLKPCKDSDNLEMLRKGKLNADEILIELSIMLGNMIPLKDLPSCKPLLDCSKDLAMVCAKDMANDKYVKIGLGLVSLLAKGNDNVTIEHVWLFYNNIINELEREVKMEGWALNQVEQALYAKAKAERAYCCKAFLKTEFGIAKEIKEVVDLIDPDKDIQSYENMHSLIRNNNQMIANQ